MSRIQQTFKKAREEGRARFVAYICAGDPDYATSLEVARTLIESGTEVLELGVPFSDPLADGLTNQLAADRALKAGMTQEKVFQLVRDIRKFSDVPIVFYTYYNLVYFHGVDNYVKQAKEAGVDGLLTLDLPPEEADDLLQACEKHDLNTVFIIAPTTPAERIRRIAEVTTGFLYYVSREGVTGERDDMAVDLEERIAGIRAETELPLVVGFGVSRPEHVSAINAHADGVVVGSALVNCIKRNLDQREKILPELRAKMKDLCSGFNL